MTHPETPSTDGTPAQPNPNSTTQQSQPASLATAPATIKPPNVTAVAIRGALSLGVVLWELSKDRLDVLGIIALIGCSLGFLGSVIQLVFIFTKPKK